ncbi:hypothetical protein ABZU76_18350 [Amycolatopsis sp. NPDC005232]|uniref:hypothetical protein n=1 Tax=Amycolatopsis sp. NPDC005232 TaxID=3157027 RepID=UPI0033B792F6
MAAHGQQAGPLKIALVATRSADDADQVALAEAARGVAQSLARELGPNVRINTVVCDGTSEKDLRPTFNFLAGPGSGYDAGATIDLRRPR